MTAPDARNKRILTMAEGHNHNGRYEVSARRRFGRIAIVVGAVALAVVAVTGASAGKKASSNPYNLNQPGTLTVGMTLQFKPQMYLDKGQPAGYDVVLLKALAKEWGVKLEIKNLDFNGLIPGLVSRKFDMVSVGLTATAERKKTISFSRPYVPYAQILAQGTKDKTGGSIGAFNQSGIVITSLQGSTAETLVQKTFPNAESKSFSKQNAAFLEVATGRANGIVVENYLLAQFQKSNPGKLKQVKLAKPLNVEYGSYGVQKGNAKLAKGLSAFICEQQANGQLAKTYQSTIGAPLPPMPGC